MRAIWMVLVAAPGCGFSIGATIEQDGGGDGEVIVVPDAPAQLGDVAHVPAPVEAAFAATASLMIADATIDTGTSGGNLPSINLTLPPGAIWITSPQDDASGPELAILEVRELTVTGALQVRGARPLVIIALDQISISGTIDASADQARPGPGGFGPRMGPGKGGDGKGDGPSYDDSGGGGGGFGAAGGAGQASGPAVAGTAGSIAGAMTLPRLEGGSGGGDMSPACIGYLAGAGGGALQLYAGGTLRVDGTIAVNGGGGAGGIVCNGLAASGAGGGSGGALYLQAGGVTGSGSMLAQGGGGGGGSNFNANASGTAGGNGAMTVAPAPGGAGAGTGVGGETNAGAEGGFLTMGAQPLVSLSGANYGNGGGGGGGVGRIVIRSALPGTVTTSPPHVVVSP